MTLVAWSKVPEKVSDMKGSESPNTCNLSKKTFGITCLVLGLILIQLISYFGIIVHNLHHFGGQRFPIEDKYYIFDD